MKPNAGQRKPNEEQRNPTQANTGPTQGNKAKSPLMPTLTLTTLDGDEEDGIGGWWKRPRQCE